MHPLDIAAITVYLLLILSLGFVFGGNQSRREFFVAGGSMGWLAVGLSVMAPLFSSKSFVFYRQRGRVGHPADGKTGRALCHYSW